MTDKHDYLDETAIDPLVSAQFAAIATESAPPDLDRAVMQKARKAAQSGGRRSAIMVWMRPAAFVATAILSFGLILEFNESNTSATPDSTAPALRLPGGDASTAARPEDAAQNKTAAELANALRREKSAAALASKMAAPETGNDDAAVTIGATGGDESMPATLALPAGPDARSQRSLLQVPVEDSNRAVESARHCSDEQSADAMAWWLCIEALREAGQVEVADAEVELLRTAFPGFVLPQ